MAHITISRPLPVHAERFLADLDSTRKTAVTYRCGLRLLAEFLGLDTPASGAGSRDYDQRTLVDFSLWLRNVRGLKTMTERCYVSAAQRFVEWLDLEGLLPVHASRMSLMLRQRRGRGSVRYMPQPIKDCVPRIVHYFLEQDLGERPVPVSRGWRKRWKRRLTLLRNRALTYMLFITGGRCAEVAALSRGAVANGHATEAMALGKGAQKRVLRFDSEAQRLIQEYLTERDHFVALTQARLPGRTNEMPLFVRHDREGTQPLSTRHVWKIVADSARAIGEHITPHDFRRYMATQLLNEGMPLESVQKFLGHASILTTRQVYAHTRDDVLNAHLAAYRPNLPKALERSHEQEARAASLASPATPQASEAPSQPSPPRAPEAPEEPHAEPATGR